MVYKNPQRKYLTQRAKKLYKKYHTFCESCNSLNNLEIHHKLPLSHGGFNGWANLQTLCKSCHKIITIIQNKRDKDIIVILEAKLIKRGYDKDKIYFIMVNRACKFCNYPKKVKL